MTNIFLCFSSRINFHVRIPSINNWMVFEALNKTIFNLWISRESRPEMCCKKGVFKNFVKFTGTHLRRGLFLNKVAGLRPATLLKKRLWHKCFLVNFTKFLRTPFFINTSGGCLWISVHLKFWLDNYWWLYLNFVVTFLTIRQILEANKFKVGLSPSRKICVICLIESPLKIMKNVFYFVLKAFFVLKIFKFLSRHFSHVGKMTWLER